MLLPMQSVPLAQRDFAIPVTLTDGTSYVLSLVVCNTAGLCASSTSTPFVPDASPPFVSPLYDLMPYDDGFMCALREAYTGLGQDPEGVSSCSNATLSVQPSFTPLNALLACLPAGVNTTSPLLPQDVDGSWETASTFDSMWWEDLALASGDPCALGYWVTGVSAPTLPLHVRWASGDPHSHIDRLVVSVGTYAGGADVLPGVVVLASAASPPLPRELDLAALQAAGPGVYALQRFRQFWDAYVVVPAGPGLTYWMYLYVTVKSTQQAKGFGLGGVDWVRALSLRRPFAAYNGAGLVSTSTSCHGVLHDPSPPIVIPSRVIPGLKQGDATSAFDSNNTAYLITWEQVCCSFFPGRKVDVFLLLRFVAPAIVVGYRRLGVIRRGRQRVGRNDTRRR